MRARLERVLRLIQDAGGDAGLTVPDRLCRACPAAVGVDGAGVSLIAADRFAAVATSDRLAADVEVLQATLGEGPCYDAVSGGDPVFAGDLASDDSRDRWPTFCQSALDAGIRSVFGFPLTLGGNPVGALDMYSRQRRMLSDEDISDALILADLTAIAVQDLSGRGRIDAVGLSSGLDEPWAHQSIVHHATGMTAVHLGVGVDEAVLRLRAYAFAASRALADVATDVVARRLTLERWSAER